ncbi:hypothetical protein MACH07_22070 [Flagellimonas marinaquae]|uniref:Uncharacterized protein n=1 Tax=Flagellimonas marinaquae TaxID=254955 RepID=A0AA48HKI6_9FLAO|nr:hypothetical protein MACH07_22070 [Allomuricauda aquimarina]
MFAQCKKDYKTTLLAGTYVNRNYDYTPFIPEIPYVSDTLVLNDDFTFKSDFWGNGTYEIKNSLKGSTIKLRYNYEFGKASYTARIEEVEKTLKIILFEKKNHYYEKIR